MLLFQSRRSDCDFQHAICAIELHRRKVNGQATLYCIVEIPKEVFERFALRDTSRNDRNFSPKATFLGFVNYDFDFHGAIIGASWLGLTKNVSAS
jgi:hypothetical protein